MGQLLMTYAPSEVRCRYNDKLMYSLSSLLPLFLSLPPSLPPSPSLLIVASFCVWQNIRIIRGSDDNSWTISPLSPWFITCTIIIITSSVFI